VPRPPRPAFRGHPERRFQRDRILDGLGRRHRHDAPTSGGCSGRYKSPINFEAGWNVPLTSIQLTLNKTISTRTPKVYLSSYVNPTQFGTCNQNDVEILRDAVAGGLDTPFGARFKVATPTLKRLGRRFSVGVDVSYSGPVPIQVSEFYQEPGAISTVRLHWRGTLNFSRAFTCQPHGCDWPPPAQ
jgi:hypothetical protein